MKYLIREEAYGTEIQAEIHRPRNRPRIVPRRDQEWRLRVPSFSKGVWQKGLGNESEESMKSRT